MEKAVESRLLYYLKAVAIYCVVCAHVAEIPEVFSSFNRVCSQILSCLGTMGVPVFFIISGYFYGRNTDTLMCFWKKKIKNIVVPWVFCGTVVWLYVVLRKGGISWTNWLLFLLGKESLYYYLPVLLFFFLALWKIRKCMYIMFGCILVSIGGVILTSYQCTIMVALNSLTATPYLNPIHWLGYFCVGIVIAHYSSMLKVGEQCSKVVWLTGLILIVSMMLHIHFGISYTYFSRYAIPNTVISTAFIMGSIWKLTHKDKRLKGMLQMGEKSYTIYLLHALIAGIIVRVTSKIDMFVLTFLRPLVVVVAVMMGIRMLGYVDKKTNGKLRLVYLLIGSRE